MTSSATDRVVPYVTLRSSEPIRSMVGAAAVDDEGRVRCELDPAYLHLSVDGWLWSNDPEDLSGQPVWRKNHPRRIRRCVEELRCQVCAELVPEPHTWIVPAVQVPRDRAERLLSHSPPVCRGCIPVSKAECPGLARAPVEVVEARGAFRFAAIGSLFAGEFAQLANGRYATVLEADSVTLRPGDPSFDRLVVGQCVMALEDWRLSTTSRL